MKKILIIDDDFFALKFLTDTLIDKYNVLNSKNGKDGIAIAESEQPSLILLDIEMPELDGFQVLKILKENEATRSIPVIFLTGIIDPKSEEKGFLYGAIDYIGKPFSRNVVKIRVKTQIEIAEYRQKIEMELKLDPLTQIYNRRGIEEHLKDFFKNAKINKYELSFILIDIDYFKMVNDTYGHLEGDSILQRLAGIIKRIVPKDKGFIGRYGGEEFSLVLNKIQKEEAQQIVWNIQEAIKKEKIPNEKSPVSKYLTISAGGITKIPEIEEEMVNFIEIADKMLYKSKKEGRNCYNWYE